MFFLHLVANRWCRVRQRNSLRRLVVAPEPLVRQITASCRWTTSSAFRSSHTARQAELLVTKPPPSTATAATEEEAVKSRVLTCTGIRTGETVQPAAVPVGAGTRRLGARFKINRDTSENLVPKSEIQNQAETVTITGTEYECNSADIKRIKLIFSETSCCEGFGKGWPTCVGRRIQCWQQQVWCTFVYTIPTYRFSTPPISLLLLPFTLCTYPDCGAATTYFIAYVTTQ